MNYYDMMEVNKEREQKVVKSNDLIRKSRYSLGAVEQKIVSYLVSKIKPGDKELMVYEFDVRDFCKVCGIDYDNGGNYEMVKNSIQKLHDKSFWVKLDNGIETTCSWVNKAWIEEKSGKVQIRLDDDLHAYLLELSANFTQYALINTLPMKSQYSIRMYELLKSYKYDKSYDSIEHQQFDIDELKRILMCENYKNFKDFRKKVLEISLREINEYTDMKVSYDTIIKGRRVISVIFCIQLKDTLARASANRKGFEKAVIGSNDYMEGQMNIYDY